MAIIKANNIDIAYQAFGEPTARPLLLISGLATQMIGWPDQFCHMLAAAGHQAIRFDNRDVGRSTKMASMDAPDLMDLMQTLQSGKSVQIPYTLSDMVSDALGLMDALGLGKAHICGVSMGGMIGQVMAMQHPDRLFSLTAIMSSTGEHDLPPAKVEANNAMMSVPPAGRADYQDYQAQVYRAFAADSPQYDDELQRQMAARSYDRGLYPLGFLRQMAAIMAAPGRRQALGSVRLPTLVIHGTHDTLLPLDHGKDLARAIPGAKLLIVQGLGHGLAFPDLWQSMVAAITRHTGEAQPG
jgi:pimeloyl-ACP methyl ester carboxylesterase